MSLAILHLLDDLVEHLRLSTQVETKLAALEFD